MNIQKNWKRVQADLKNLLSPAIYKTWFKDIKLKEKAGSDVFLHCPNFYNKEILEKNKYKNIIEDICSKIFQEEITVIIEAEKVRPKEQKKGPLFGEKLKTTSLSKTIMNQKYTFDSYIIGSSNNLAAAAAKAIVESPGKAYNPFFIYGGVGLGKTHMICAIGNEIIYNNPTKKINYITSEKFTNELILAIQKNRTQQFREKYRQTDVLIIDDIQFFAGKEASQEEFFHTFNSLYTENKQIILSSDKPPREIDKLEDRLISRFEGGLTVDIQPPNLETRIAILNLKCEEKKITISQEIIEYIAENITNNVRQLEGILSQLVTFSLFQKKELTLENAKKILGDKKQKGNKKITPLLIMDTIAEFYGIKIKDIKGKSRKAQIVKPRQIIMYFMRKELNIPLVQIGKYVGNRDHTTVMHSIEKIEIQTEKKIPEYYSEIRTLKSLILQH